MKEPKILRMDSIQIRPFITLVNKVMSQTNTKASTAVVLGVDYNTLTKLIEQQTLTFNQATRILAGYKKWKQSLLLETS